MPDHEEELPNLANYARRLSQSTPEEYEALLLEKFTDHRFRISPIIRREITTVNPDYVTYFIEFCPSLTEQQLACVYGLAYAEFGITPDGFFKFLKEWPIQHFEFSFRHTDFRKPAPRQGSTKMTEHTDQNEQTIKNSYKELLKNLSIAEYEDRLRRLFTLERFGVRPYVSSKDNRLNRSDRVFTVEFYPTLTEDQLAVVYRKAYEEFGITPAGFTQFIKQQPVQHFSFVFPNDYFLHIPT